MLYKIHIMFFFRHDESGMQTGKHKVRFHHYIDLEEEGENKQIVFKNTNLEEEGENTERVSLRSVHCVAVVGIRVL